MTRLAPCHFDATRMRFRWLIVVQILGGLKCVPDLDLSACLGHRTRSPRLMGIQIVSPSLGHAVILNPISRVQDPTFYKIYASSFPPPGFYQLVALSVSLQQMLRIVRDLLYHLRHYITPVRWVVFLTLQFLLHWSGPSRYRYYAMRWHCLGTP